MFDQLIREIKPNETKKKKRVGAGYSIGAHGWSRGGGGDFGEEMVVEVGDGPAAAATAAAANSWMMAE